MPSAGTAAGSCIYGVDRKFLLQYTAQTLPVTNPGLLNVESAVVVDSFFAGFDCLRIAP